MAVSRKVSQWDAFISHATEDKGFARPLANALSTLGARVWFDEFSLKLGDNLGEEIDRGLAKSKFGIVILSPSFFKKKWPQRELEGLVAREVSGRSVILPLWHKVTFEDVCNFSPTLANKVAANTEGRSAEQIAIQILSVIRPDIAGGTSYRDLHNAAEGEGLNDLREELGQKKGKRSINPHHVHTETEFESIKIDAPIGCSVKDVALVEDGKVALVGLTDARYLLGVVEKMKLALGNGIPQHYRALHLYSVKSRDLINRRGNFDTGILAVATSPDGSQLALVQESGICTVLDLKTFKTNDIGEFGCPVYSFDKVEIHWHSDSRACIIWSEKKILYWEVGHALLEVNVPGTPHECPARRSWLFLDRDAVRETDGLFSKNAHEIFVLDDIGIPDSEAQMAVSPSGALAAIAQIYSEGDKSFACIDVYHTGKWRHIGHLRLEVWGFRRVLEWVSEDYIGVRTRNGFEIYKVPDLHLTYSLNGYGDGKVHRDRIGNVWITSDYARSLRMLSLGKLN